MVRLLTCGPKGHLRAESQPIWILIGLLLAMIIGIMMYQMVARAGSQAAFSDMMANIDEGTARVQVREGCNSWWQSNWAVPPANIGKLSDYAAKLNLLSKSEWDRRETFSKCDCAMYLFVDRSLSKSDVEGVYDPEMCHDWANVQAEELSIVQ